MTRSQAQRAVRHGRVLVDGVAQTRPSVVVGPGQELTLLSPEAHETPPPAFAGLIEVVYEDDQMAVVNKPPGVASHPSRGHEAGTVVDWFRISYPSSCQAFDSAHPGLVHRLDAGTSGALMLAKTPAAQHVLSEQLRLRHAEKLYLAVVEGIPNEARAIVDAPLSRHPVDRLRISVASRGRASRTAYEVLATGDGCALLAVRPETGRTHQIRVHLAAIGHPICGDGTYGRPSELIERQALHAAALTVDRPSDERRLEARAGLPADFRSLLAALGLESAASPYFRSGWQVLEDAPSS
jgi:23S rRNA pseudouridine1911/1915/1917 synthase